MSNTMSANDMNVRDANDTGKERVDADLLPLSSRATRDELRRIDLACVHLGKKRSHFLLEAALEKSEEVLRAVS